MRMTPRQRETRCTHYMVHFVLNEQQRRSPFWSQPATLTLMGKGPKFIPKAKALSTTEMLGACARLNYRMARAFERFVRRNEHKRMNDVRRESGIHPWAPKHYHRSLAERIYTAFSNVPTKMEHGETTNSFLQLSIGICRVWSEISSQQPLAPR